MANFVLIPGFWLGAWAWRDVTKILREKGHEVFPVTLTGLGERAHLRNKEIDLSTHLWDVVNLIDCSELKDVYLVGHSYGGIVATEVAEHSPESLAKVIYVDAAPLPGGAALIDFYQPAVREDFEKSVAEHGDGWLLPLPPRDSELFSQTLKDVSDEDWARFEHLATPQPFNVAYQKLSLKNPARRNLPKLAIVSSFSVAQVKELIASGAPLFQELADPNFEFTALPTGHYPMFTRAAELAEILDRAAN